MKEKEEKAQLNESSKKLIFLAVFSIVVILVATLLFSITNRNTQQIRGEYQPPVSSSEPSFLQNEPEEELTPDEDLAFDPPPPQSIFNRRPVGSGQQVQQQTPQRQHADRRRDLYENALNSQIKVGERVELNQPTQNYQEQPTNQMQSRQQNYSAQQNTQQTVTFDNPLTPYTIMQGTMIEARLQTAVSSALPGAIVGIINRDIYDSINQNHLLIPRGTRVIGDYESSIAFDQRKMMMAWNRLIFPDGRSMILPSFPTHDLEGMSGLGGEVNTHFWRIFGQSAMLSMIGAGASLVISPNRSGLLGSMNAREIIAMEVAEDFQRVSNMVFQRNMNRQPTIEIDAGSPFTIFLLDDISFEEPYSYTETWYGR